MLITQIITNKKNETKCVTFNRAIGPKIGTTATTIGTTATSIDSVLKISLSQKPHKVHHFVVYDTSI